MRKYIKLNLDSNASVHTAVFIYALKITSSWVTVDRDSGLIIDFIGNMAELVW